MGQKENYLTGLWPRNLLTVCLGKSLWLGTFCSWLQDFGTLCVPIVRSYEGVPWINPTPNLPPAVMLSPPTYSPICPSCSLAIPFRRTLLVIGTSLSTSALGWLIYVSELNEDRASIPWAQCSVGCVCCFETDFIQLHERLYLACF